MDIDNLMIVSACQAHSQARRDLWINHVRTWRLDWRIYDVDKFGCGARRSGPDDDRLDSGSTRTASASTPDLIRHALRRFQRPLLWLDIDTCLIRQLHGVVEDVDVAVTMTGLTTQGQKPEQATSGKIDARFVFVNSTAQGELFIEQWAEATRRTGAVQRTLVQTVKQAAARKASGELAGARIRILPAESFRRACAAAVPANDTQQAPGKLRLGARGKGRDGWVHLDSHPSADVAATVPPLPAAVMNRTWQTIEAIHVWEHFYKWEAEQLARSAHDILVPGGQLHIECPNLEVACRSFLGQGKDSDRYHMHVFYGSPEGQDRSYGHHWGYTPESLRRQLVEHGGFRLHDVTIEPAQYHVPDRDFRIVAGKS